MTPIARFRKATDEHDFDQIADLAATIWREHYTPIIGKPQVDYMLEKFQSKAAIARQAADNLNYFLIQTDNTPIGYLAIQKRGRELFLSKIYLLKEYRGRGFGKTSMEFIRKKALEFECDQIALTVNKNNDRSIGAYSKMGFVNEGPLVTDIGGGFAMDDYRMVLTLNDMPSGVTGSSPI